MIRAVAAVLGAACIVGPSLAVGEPYYVEMRPLRVAVDGGGGDRDVTPVLEFASQSGVEKACAAAPRLMEAFVREAAGAPVSFGEQGAPDQASFSGRLSRRAARVLGALAPDEIHLAPGLRPGADPDARPGPFTLSRRCTNFPFLSEWGKEAR